MTVFYLITMRYGLNLDVRKFNVLIGSSKKHGNFSALNDLKPLNCFAHRNMSSST